MGNKFRKQIPKLGGLLLPKALLLILFLELATVRPVYAYDCTKPDELALVCLEDIFANVLKGVLSLVGIVSFLFIIKGGVQYTTSGGDVKAIDSARKTLTWSIIGLGFSVTAFFVLQLLSQTFGADILRFVIPTPAP